MMNQELHWLTHRLKELRSSAQQTRWHLDELQSFRQELSPVWNDGCANEMSRRFLDPMSGDATISLAELDRQIALLDACIVSLGQAQAECTNASQAAGETQRSISEAEAILRSLDSVLGEAADQTNQASTHAGRAADFIAQANAAGM